MAVGITTPEVCKRVGISRATLHFWIRLGRVAAPPRTTIGKVTARRWSEQQIEAVRKFRGTLKPGRPRKGVASPSQLAMTLQRSS
jgi:predicted DNA-binding transcriptional regulator AlpA